MWYYQNVLYRNLKAIEADELYNRKVGTETFMLFTEYIIFILLFMVQCFGQNKNAISLVKNKRRGNDNIVRLYPDIFETFIVAAPHVYVRFNGKKFTN